MFERMRGCLLRPRQLRQLWQAVPVRSNMHQRRVHLPERRRQLRWYYVRESCHRSQQLRFVRQAVLVRSNVHQRRVRLP